jgi:SAM-dependent methyltransferase
MSSEHRDLAVPARHLFGTDPEGYAAGRPEYPERVYELLVNRCGLAEGARVLEIGPGPGLVTRHLLAVGAQVAAVEPDAALASHLEATLGGEELRVLRNTFEQADLPDDGFDLVVAGTSFHWVDPAVGWLKLGRVVKPGGWAAIWWTIFGDRSRPDPFHDATKRLVDEAIAAHTPSDPSATARTPANRGSTMFELDIEQRRLDLRERAGMQRVEGELVRWTGRMSTTEVRAFYGSTIRILRLPAESREPLLNAVAQAAEDQFGGIVERPFVTSIYTGQRAPLPG